jgi:hypothetical protein
MISLTGIYKGGSGIVMCEGYLHDGIERVETSFAYNTTYTAQSEKTFQDDVGEKSPHSTQHHSSHTVQNMLKHFHLCAIEF